MFQFSLRQLMLFMLVFGVGLVVGPPIDRQILWLRMRWQYARCMKAADEHLRLTGAGVFVPFSPDEKPYLKRAYWEDRAELVQELKSLTHEANSLEGTVRSARSRWNTAAKSATLSPQATP
jgi:hypothetical protein